MASHTSEAMALELFYLRSILLWRYVLSGMMELNRWWRVPSHWTTQVISAAVKAGLIAAEDDMP